MSNAYKVVSGVLLLFLVLGFSNGESFTSIVAKHMKRTYHVTKYFVNPSTSTNQHKFLQPSKGLKSDYSVNVGSFRFVYTAPDALEPTEDEYFEAHDLTFGYVADYLFSTFEPDLYSIGVGFSFSYDADSSTYPMIYIQWLDFIVTFYNETSLSPTDIFEVITPIVVNNQTYLDQIQNLTDTPFALVTDVDIDDYFEGTLYPTSVPYPTPSPVPIPVTPVVSVPLGNITISYTSPGASQPSDDDFLDAMIFTYVYLEAVFINSFGSDNDGADLSASQIDYKYIDATSKPNIITTYLSVNATFPQYRRDIPTVSQIVDVLIESIDATYIDQINEYGGGLFGIVVDAIMQVDTVPTPSPTKVDSMTEAPVPKSRRKPHH